MHTNTMHSDDRVAAEAVILQELASAPVAVAELKKRVCSRVQGLKAAPYKSALDALLTERKVHGQASLNKSGKPGKVSSYALGAPPPPPRERAPREVLKALRAGPKAASALKQEVKQHVPELSDKDFSSVLGELIAAGSIHGRHKRNPNGSLAKTVESYALGAPPPPPPPPRQLAPREVVLNALNAGPRAASALKKEVKQHVRGLSDPDFTSVLGELIAAGSIHCRHKRNPNGSFAKGVESYALGRLPPDEFIEPVLALWAKMRAAGIAAGVNDGTLVSALLDALRRNGVAMSANGGERSSGTDGERIMRSVHQLLEREGRGALIPVRKLRVAAALSKERFDAAVLELYHTDQVILHHHDNVGNMSEAERNELVVDQYENHYVGLALAGGQ